MNTLATLLDLRLWVPKGSARQRKIAAEPAAYLRESSLSASPKKTVPLQLPLANITKEPGVGAHSLTSPHPIQFTHATTTPHAPPAAPLVAPPVKEYLRLSMVSLTPSCLLLIENVVTDGEAEQQLMHSLLQAIQKQKQALLPPIKCFQWPPETRSTLAMGTLNDALSGLFFQIREQGILQIVILNHQLHRFLINDKAPPLHASIPHNNGLNLIFSSSLHAMQHDPQLKKAFWFFLKSQL